MPLIDPIRTVEPLRFVIYGQEYGDASCGVRVLNRLCHWLNVLGHDASIGNVYKVHPDWEVKRWDGIITPETIAVYPEILHGNPFNARRVARWVLYHPGAAGHPSRPQGPLAFGPHERCYYYSSVFEASTKAVSHDHNAKKLYVSAFEPDVLYPWNGPKLYDAFWVGRGTDVVAANPNAIDCSRMLEVWHHPTRAAFAKALRRARNFYCFDPLSAMIPEAMLCGAKAHVINMDGTIRKITPTDPEAFAVYDDPFAFYKAGDVKAFVQDMREWEL